MVGEIDAIASLAARALVCAYSGSGLASIGVLYGHRNAAERVAWVTTAEVSHDRSIDGDKVLCKSIQRSTACSGALHTIDSHAIEGGFCTRIMGCAGRSASWAGRISRARSRECVTVAAGNE